MPSKARRPFDANCKDVNRLVELHGQVGGSGPGRRYGLEVLNKSAVVLVTAFWEAYCEDLATEALEHLVTRADNANKLPVGLRKRVAKELERDAHDLAVWQLSGDGWRGVLRSRLDEMRQERNRRLNTPKTANINQLFLEAVGIDKVSSSWAVRSLTATQSAALLDKYVELRGAIAHRGSGLRSTRKKDVTDYYDLVRALVGKTGGRINAAVKKATGSTIW